MIWFGGDYNPDQWPASVWPVDVALMRTAGVNLVTVGVFSWSRLQPSPDSFDFDWLDQVLDLLHDNGIGVCLATPTASPPPWFTRAHPDAMPVTAQGVRLTHGSRDTYCVNAPAFQTASLRIAGELAGRYGHHPAVRLWHVHNEYGTTCYCDHCAVAFRGWLAARYKDTNGLNDAWSTDFWSQRYGSFEEVLPPRATQYLSNPAHRLDYRRFVSDAMLGHFKAQRDLLPGPVTTNFVLGGWVPVDHARWAREVDVVAVDDYPSRPDDHLADRAFVGDLARGWAGGEPWILMEHAPGAVGGQVLPGGSVEAIASAYLECGAAGIMYFQWRASRGGAEQWHPAMVPHQGPATPIFREITALGASLRGRSPVRVAASTALVYDEEALWAWQSPHRPAPAIDYEATARRWHRALDSPVDVVPPSAALDGYRLVVAPLLLLICAAGHAALRSYVDGGGTLVLTYGCGLTDESCRMTPGSLDDLLGVRVIRHLTAPTWLDDLEPAGASVRLRDDEGRPTVTEHRYGAGLVRYLATDLADLTPWMLA